MLFQPPDLLSLDPGYFPVPVHIPNNTNTIVEASAFKSLGINTLYPAETNTVESTIKAAAYISVTCPCRA